MEYPQEFPPASLPLGHLHPSRHHGSSREALLPLADNRHGVDIPMIIYLFGEPRISRQMVFYVSRAGSWYPTYLAIYLKLYFSDAISL